MTSTEVHAMLDIETFSQGSNAFILQIAMKVFDPLGAKNTTDFLVVNIDRHLPQQGAELEISTIEWWDKQPIEVQEEVMSGTGTLQEALIALNDFVEQKKITHIWANSPSFDCVIISNAFKRCEIENKLPEFWAWRDMRTAVAIANMMGANLPKLENTHNAIEDVENQIKLVKKSLDFLSNASYS